MQLRTILANNHHENLTAVEQHGYYEFVFFKNQKVPRDRQTVQPRYPQDAGVTMGVARPIFSNLKSLQVLDYMEPTSGIEPPTC